ncbi:hypothetical protein ACP3WI_24705, partial [Salmonella enterica]
DVLKGGLGVVFRRNHEANLAVLFFHVTPKQKGPPKRAFFLPNNAGLVTNIEPTHSRVQRTFYQRHPSLFPPCHWQRMRMAYSQRI